MSPVWFAVAYLYLSQSPEPAAPAAEEATEAPAPESAEAEAPAPETAEAETPAPEAVATEAPAPEAVEAEAPAPEAVKAEAPPVEAPVATATGEAPWARLHLQVRPRAEKAFVGHLGVPRAPGLLSRSANYATTSRIRVGAEGGVGNARARVTVQDVRTWASESGTLTDFSAEGIDFHEGWAQLGSDSLFLRVGRQELALDGQRLIGAVNWAQQARAFDAAMLKHTAADHEVTMFAARVADGFLHDVFAAHGMLEVADVRVAMPLIFQTNALIARQNRGAQRETWHRFTGGLHASAEGRISWRAEAYLQTGTEHAAYMVGGRVGTKINDLFRPTLWVDFLSGDTDLEDGESGAFDTLFATNHRLYGYMDRFVAIPTDTRGGGLIDLALKNEASVGPGTLELAVHEFLLAAADASPATGEDHSPLIGFEADLVYALPISEWAQVMAGAALFFDQGDFREERRAVNEDAPTMHDWFFLMLDVSI